MAVIAGRRNGIARSLVDRMGAVLEADRLCRSIPGHEMSRLHLQWNSKQASSLGRLCLEPDTCVLVTRGTSLIMTRCPIFHRHVSIRSGSSVTSLHAVVSQSDRCGAQTRLERERSSFVVLQRGRNDGEFLLHGHVFERCSTLDRVSQNEINA